MSDAASGLKKEFKIPFTNPGSSFDTAARIPEISSGDGISFLSLKFFHLKYNIVWIDGLELLDNSVQLDGQGRR